MNLDEALQTFIAESRELLDDMEASLLSLAKAPQDDGGGEAINAIFRAAHTIKGSAGLFGLDHVVAFTHVAESVLDEVRAGRVAIGAPLIALLLSCCDHMRALTEELAAGRTGPDAALQAAGEPLTTALRTHLDPNSAAANMKAAPATAAPTAKPPEGYWHISLRFGEGVLRNGMDPMSFLRYLATIGRIHRIVTLADAMPEAGSMDPECCYLGFEIEFETQADKATIEGVFEFVLDDCTLRILPPASRIEDYVALIRALPEEPTRLGDILARCGCVTAHEIARAIDLQAHPDPADSAPPRLGSILVEQASVPPAVLQAALDKQEKVKDAKARENQSIRVDADKLDRLIDLVGELIIASAGAGLAARRTADLELHEAHSTLAGLVQEVRDSALQLRMVKIGASFQRFQRVVHDVSKDLGKDIALVIKGEDTELDKTVVEKIADPLTHLVRNAMDHGIGMPEARRRNGQPEQGTITLNAFHDAGQVVIQVSDDGNGMDPAHLVAKAVEKGLLAPDAQLSDAEAFNLIFEPGFSTAAAVTNLSGRGVGMDVVKRNIMALRGTVGIQSVYRVGTTVTVRLPLTLAIIDGFQVAVGAAVFVVPLDMVEECVEYPGAGEPQGRGDGDSEHDYIDLRGQVLPLIRLRSTFDLGGRPGVRQNIVVLRHAEEKVGLVVDKLLGEAQTVIKPLSSVFSHVKGISGSSIRGSGDVALILDVPALIKQACQSGGTPPSQAPKAAAAQP
jgi:two-component system chemotaxis sensor kinase CheA